MGFKSYYYRGDSLTDPKNKQILTENTRIKYAKDDGKLHPEDRQILLNLVKGHISEEIYLKLDKDDNLAPQEQEDLFSVMKQQAEFRGKGYGRDFDLHHKWFYEIYQRARYYGINRGWLTVPFDRIHTEAEELENSLPKTIAVPFKYNQQFAYHATDYKVLERIKQIGLTPRDPHAETGFENNRAVFFFKTSKEAIELSKGLLEDDVWQQAAILKIDVAGLPLYKRSTGSKTGAGEEFFTNKKVIPTKIVGITIV